MEWSGEEWEWGWSRMEWSGVEASGMEWEWEWSGVAWSGATRRGAARLVVAWHGKHGAAWCGAALFCASKKRDDL